MSNTDNNNIEMLHIYGQYAHHDDVEIMGNRAGLERLRMMIDAVLRENNPLPVANYETVWVGDGEGYGLHVTLYDKPDFKDWGKVAVPYIADWAGETREDAIWPNMVKKLIMGMSMIALLFLTSCGDSHDVASNKWVIHSKWQYGHGVVCYEVRETPDNIKGPYNGAFTLCTNNGDWDLNDELTVVKKGQCHDEANDN